MTDNTETETDTNATGHKIEISHDQRTHDPQTGDLQARRIIGQPDNEFPREIRLEWKDTLGVYHLLEYRKKDSDRVINLSGIVLDRVEIRTIYALTRHAVDTHNGEIEGAVLFSESGSALDDLDVVA